MSPNACSGCYSLECATRCKYMRPERPKPLAVGDTVHARVLMLVGGGCAVETWRPCKVLTPPDNHWTIDVEFDNGIVGGKTRVRLEDENWRMEAP